MAKSEQFKLKHYVNYIGVATAAVVLGALSLAGVLSSSWQIIFENIA